MTENLLKKVNELRAVLEQDMPKGTTSVSVYITYDGADISITTKTAVDLKREGVSMRDIRGSFIK